ncbi:MAG: DUF4129 domain-containing protein [Clostridia bacterium]|nr:DUF4129 domain-containing protein [Clostridia bacterium]
MIVLLFTKLLSDIGYYFVFAHYLGGYIGVTYSFALTVGVMCLAGALSAVCAKKGALRLLPPALAMLLLLQGHTLMDFVVMVPPLIYLWAVCIKEAFVPDGNEYKELFALQLKTLVALPFIFVFKPDMHALKNYCLPALILFLLSAVLAMRMMRHSTDVLKSPRFQLQNALTVGALLTAAWAISSKNFLKITGKAVAALRWILAPVFQAAAVAVSWAFTVFMRGVMALFGFLGRVFGNDNFEKPQIEVQDGIKEEMDLLEGYVAPDSKTFVTVIMVIVIIIGLICAYFIFRRMLYRRKRQDAAGFSLHDLPAPAKKAEKDTLLAPKDPREAVRWHYRRYLRYCRSRDVPLKPSLDSGEINRLAESREVACSSETSPLRQVYLTARYSEKTVTEQDAKQAKELVKRIKEGQK